MALSKGGFPLERGFGRAFAPWLGLVTGFEAGAGLIAHFRVWGMGWVFARVLIFILGHHTSD